MRFTVSFELSANQLHELRQATEADNFLRSVGDQEVVEAFANAGVNAARSADVRLFAQGWLLGAAVEGD